MQATLAEMDRVCLDEALHLNSAGQLRVWRVAYEDLAYGQHVASGKDLLDALQRWLRVEPSTLHVRGCAAADTLWVVCHTHDRRPPIHPVRDTPTPALALSRLC